MTQNLLIWKLKSSQNLQATLAKNLHRMIHLKTKKNRKKNEKIRKTKKGENRQKKWKNKKKKMKK